MHITKYNSPMGNMVLAAEDEFLCGLWFLGQKYFDTKIFKTVVQDDILKIFKQTKDWLDRYFRGEKPSVSELKLAPKGSDFRQEVWKILLAIPYGETMTYGEIARIIADKKGLNKMSAQAVGGAIGHNPISIIIPCHRVLGQNGQLTGYAGGIDKKKWLLSHEDINFKE